VYNALRHLHESAIVGDHDWILVHDAARPGLTSRLINKLIEELSNDAVGGLLALPVVDTVKRLADGKLQTVPRDGLWLAQTPQMFRHALLLKALENSNDVTDEASAIEQLGLSPRLVEGHANNRKITLPEDLIFFRQHLSL
jgi:2-C-methyl-D-erythritol 4-phosphate cytidylyltransferase